MCDQQCQGRQIPLDAVDYYTYVTRIKFFVTPIFSDGLIINNNLQSLHA